MYHYLDALVNNRELNFPQALLKEIFELFFDIIVIFVHPPKETIDPSNGMYRLMNNQVSQICQFILASDLIIKIEPGLAALDPEEQLELRTRYQQTCIHIDGVKNSMMSHNGN